MKQRVQRVERINALEPGMQDLSDAGLRERADSIRARLADGAVSFGEEGAVAGRGTLDPAASLTGGASAASSTGHFVLPPRIR